MSLGAPKVLRQTDPYKEAPILQKTLRQPCIRGIYAAACAELPEEHGRNHMYAVETK
jgi:hypothetical protein